ncbi:MAG TPA: NYN domain-containing protein [Acidimicrobiales bacterium]|nr:NYN domain-containing protein [Acidimicrobiales bacterium]
MADAESGAGSPSVGDRMLRPTLQLAFDVARVGARSSPPVDAPRVVRPFLHFTGRLPDAALTAVRRALDEDAGFRARVAGLADEEELGRPGWLFVVRPDGWEGELAVLVDDATAAARAEQEEREERSARRRLAHAEHAAERAEAAAARARAELTGTVAELATERRARRAAQDDAERLGRRVTSLEGERDSARRRAAEASAEVERVRLELEAVQGEVAQLRVLLSAARAEARAAAESTAAGTSAEATAAGESEGAAGVGASARAGTGGGAAGTSPGAAARAGTGGGAAGTAADPAGGIGAAGARAGGADLDAVAEAVAVAASAASMLGRALADASTALAGSPPVRGPDTGRVEDTGPSDTVPGASGKPPPPPARRRPAPLPPAVFDDTAEAAAHLVRIPGALVLVDGYNAAKALWPDVAPLELRERLVDALRELVARTGAAVHVVFDGADLGVPSFRPVASRGVRVSFSPADVEADDVILDLVDTEPPSRHVVVASSDRRVQDGARRRGANVISSAQLAAVLGRS